MPMWVGQLLQLPAALHSHTSEENDVAVESLESHLLEPEKCPRFLTRDNKEASTDAGARGGFNWVSWKVDQTLVHSIGLKRNCGLGQCSTVQNCARP